MRDDDTERLRDRVLEPAALSAEEAVGEGIPWTVRMGPEAVPEALLHFGKELRSFAFAAAMTPLDEALKTLEKADLDPQAPVVVLDGDRVLGVWTGLDLATARLRGVSRQATDVILTGDAFIPRIHKNCGYEQAGVRCTQILVFVEKPLTMPPCPNGQGFTAHDFGW